jgi:hypothetical protein
MSSRSGHRFVLRKKSGGPISARFVHPATLEDAGDR